MCRDLKRLGIIFLLTLSASLTAAAQGPGNAAAGETVRPAQSATPTDDEVRTRVKVLEQQVEMLRRELNELKVMAAKSSSPGPAVTAKTETQPAAAQKAEPVAASPATPAPAGVPQ